MMQEQQYGSQRLQELKKNGKNFITVGRNFKLEDKRPDEKPHTTDMSELESEEPAEQKGVGLKILTPDQMLSRLPITLAQLKTGKIQKNLKKKSGNYCTLSKDQKINQNNL